MPIVLDWPAPNSLAWLRLPCCDAEHPTRVEDFDNDDCVIATPSTPHTETVNPQAVAGGFFIGWVNGRGALEVPVDLVRATEQPIPTWTLRALGPGVETQRRSFVRLEQNHEIKLYLLEGGAGTIATALDMSEGGLRCQVDRWATDPGDRPFTTEVQLGDREYFLASQISWRGNADAAGNRELGIRFLQIDQATSDSIRSYIFAAQLEARRRTIR